MLESDQRDTPISVIVLNQGDATCLENFLESVAALPCRDRLEIVLVDHGFQNALSDVLRRKSEGLFIRHIRYVRHKECSIASLLDYALSRASHPRRLVLVANRELTSQSLQEALDRTTDCEGHSTFFQPEAGSTPYFCEAPDDAHLQEPLAGLNVVFVTPDEFGEAQDRQARLLARRMGLYGVACCIVPACNEESLRDCPSGNASRPLHFSDGRGPDVVHAWTLRAPVRRTCEKLLEEHACLLAAHIEADDIRCLSQDEAVGTENEREVHTFMAKVRCLTANAASLRRPQQAELPFLAFAPLVDESLYHPRPINFALRRELDIPAGHMVLGCALDVHAENRRGVAALYQAVALLNQQGLGTTLVRIGLDFEELEVVGDVHIRRLGRQSDRRTAEILATADILVRPGADDPDDDIGIAPDVPACFAQGRPVVLRQSCLERRLRPGEDAFVLESADAAGIARAIEDIRSRDGLAEWLSMQATRFYRNEFYEPLLPQALLLFYRQRLENFRQSA